jgi:hypothetical protein
MASVARVLVMWPTGEAFPVVKGGVYLLLLPRAEVMAEEALAEEV